MSQRPRTVVLALAGALTLSGCLHHMDIQQGNYIDPKHVAQLHKGMSEKRVIKLLGAPVLKNVFNNHELVYVYTMKKPNTQTQSKKLDIFFKQGRLTRYESFNSER